jgi:hypothetical protein
LKKEVSSYRNIGDIITKVKWCAISKDRNRLASLYRRPDEEMMKSRWGKKD